jgi:phytoene dehydrogenase-like protein
MQSSDAISTTSQSDPYAQHSRILRLPRGAVFALSSNLNQFFFRMPPRKKKGSKMLKDYDVDYAVIEGLHVCIHVRCV